MAIQQLASSGESFLLHAARDFDPGMADILGLKTDKHPSTSNYPSNRFSSDGYMVWRALLESEDCQAEYNALSAPEAWFLILKRFLKRCDKEGIVPFKHVSIQTNNDVVTAFLLNARRKLIKLYTDSEMFDRVSVQKVTRNYHFSAGDFQITVEATIRPGYDPTLKNWLPTIPHPRFIKGTAQGYYHRQLTQSINAYARFAGQRLVLGYQIFCHTVPELSDWKTAPSRNKMTQFAEKQIWLPIVRAHKIPGTGINKRLF